MKDKINRIKEAMVYVRNNATDKNLYHITSALKDSIINQGSPPDRTKVQWKMEPFIGKSLDILLKAIKDGETDLIYDISDMLQGIPDIEYWERTKNMRDYRRDYVRPVERKWKLYDLGR